MGLVVNSMPTFKKPQRRSDVKLIDGKAGASVTEYGYAPYSLPCKVTLTDISKLDAIIAWLDGTGVLICSDDPLKYRDVRILEEVDYQRMGDLKETTIEFYVPIPFRFLVTESPVTLTSSGSITNTGTVDSMPLLKLTGTGTVVLTIGSKSFTYIFDTPYVYIDCGSYLNGEFKQDAYYGATLKNRKMTGEFPKLLVGANAISWTGTLTELVVTKRSCWL